MKTTLRGGVAASILSRTPQFATMMADQVIQMAAGPALPIPNRQQLDAYNVNREGWEGVTNTLYDSIAYAAAGQTQLTFFALPVGQGTGLGGGTKTLSDTNMTIAGSLPANQEFLVQSIELMFNPTTPSVADSPSK